MGLKPCAECGELVSIKYLRVVESPPKRSWSWGNWPGQGYQAPGMNWHSFEGKRILGEAEVEHDGSVYVEVPAGKFVYFQLLDENRKMVQSMRSGTMVQPGEVRGCIGCHEDRLSVPLNQQKLPMAMKKRPSSLLESAKKAEMFSYAHLVQPIFDQHCIKCHDFGPDNESGLVLAGDRNPYFNASYIDLHVKKIIKPIGGGPANIQQPNSWGAKASKLVGIIDEGHHEVDISEKEKQMLYTWLDLNAVYYPSYESAYPENPAGRSPLTKDEMMKLAELTGTDFNALKSHQRADGPQVSFERPALSPCLQQLEKRSKKYNKALEIIYLGQQRLERIPRADMDGFEPAEEQKQKIKRYLEQKEKERLFREAMANGEKRYDAQE